jgi:hypothetical protein
MMRLIITTLVTLVSLAATAVAADEELPLLSFVVGDYVIIGKAPDNGPMYSGQGRIEKKGGKLVLYRQINGKRSIAEGVVAVPSPPNEGEVLRFTWIENGPREMTCLVNSDLDNFARLTCYWVTPKQRHTEPGMEAMFPTTAWPNNAPNKSLSGTPQSSAR